MIAQRYQPRARKKRERREKKYKNKLQQQTIINVVSETKDLALLERTRIETGPMASSSRVAGWRNDSRKRRRDRRDRRWSRMSAERAKERIRSETVTRRPVCAQ